MSDFIPQFSLARQFAPLRSAIEAATQRVFASGQVVLGPETAALERELAQYLGVPYAMACASGTDALHLALRSLGLGPGDVVLTSAFTFFATAGAVLLSGAELALADIDPTSMLLAPEAVQAFLRGPQGKRVRAIIPVHLYGRAVDVSELRRHAPGIPMIEDTAQAFGACTPAGFAGTLADMGCYSFYPTKNLGALGEGGLVVTGNAEFAEQLRMRRVHGSRQRYVHEHIGWNARLDEVQAAILRLKLPQVQNWNQRRRTIAERYQQGLLRGSFAAIAGQGDAPVLLPAITPEHVFHQYVLRTRRRDALREHLKSAGIGSEVYYPIPVHLQPVLADTALARQTFPHAEQAANEVLALPMFPELGDDEVERVVAAVHSFFAG